MTEIKHTPGPWEYVPSNGNHGAYVADMDGCSVCDCYVVSGGGSGRLFYDFQGEMSDANARLIAAAPEMLEALYEVEATAIDAYDPVMLAKVQAAIAKAEGRS